MKTKVGQQEFNRMCKRIMTPVFEAHWKNEVWERGERITVFRQMEYELDETGEEQTHLLVDALRERGASDEEMLALSSGDYPPSSHQDNYDTLNELYDDIEGRLHASLSWDLHEAFAVLVRNATNHSRHDKPRYGYGRP